MNWTRTGVVLLAVGSFFPGCKTIPENGTLSDQSSGISENAQGPAKFPRFSSKVSVKQTHNDYVTDSRLSEQLRQSSLSEGNQNTAGRIRSAANSVKDALTIDPKRVKASDPTDLSFRPSQIQPSLYLSAALLYEQQGRLPEAIQQYERLLEADPNNRSALVGLGRLNHRQGDLDRAIEVYAQAAREFPNDAVILNDFALCLARAGRTNDAVTTLYNAIGVKPDSLLYRNNLAAILVEANRSDEAVEALRRTHGPSVAHYNVAYMLNQKGQTQAATTHFTRALNADPSFEPARMMLDQLAPQIGNRPRRDTVQPGRAHTGMVQPAPEIQSPIQRTTPIETASPSQRPVQAQQVPPRHHFETLAQQPPLDPQSETFTEQPPQQIVDRPVPTRFVPFVVTAESADFQEADDVIAVSHEGPAENVAEQKELLIRLPFSRPIDRDQPNLVPPSPSGLPTTLAPDFLPIAE